MAATVAVPATASPTFSARTGHAVAIKEGGALVTWGNNAYGGYGDGRVLQHPVPHRIDVPPMTQIWSGLGTVAALDAQGRVWAWGDNVTSQLGDRTSGNNAEAAMLTRIADVVQITGGFRYVAALKRDGTVWYWGVLTAVGQITALPRQIASGARAIAGGGDHVVVLGTDGQVRVVGNNIYGQLGVPLASSATPVVVPGLSNAQRVWAAGSMSFAQTADGKLWMWGGRASVAAAQVQPPSVLQINGRAISVRGFPSLVTAEVFIATDTGRVFELPRPPEGSTAFVPPVERPPFAGAAAVIPGQNVGRVGSNDFVVVLYPDGSLRTQGGNLQGQLGDGSLVDSQAPALVRPLIDNVIDASTMVRSVVALRRDGSVWTWGSNGRAQQADGVNPSPTTPYLTPLSNVESVYAGGLFTIARTTQGKTYAWGANLQGQFCDGTSTSRSVPMPAPAFDGARQIVAATNASVFLKEDGSVWICGYFGVLGDPPATPQRVDGLPAITKIFAGTASLYAQEANGSLWAWGDNSQGQLGQGTSGGVVLVPQRVQGLPGPVAELAASNHVVALMGDGTVWSWGQNNAGQTGRTASAQPVSSPLLVAGVGQVVEVAAGGLHSLARRSDGSIWVWGLNSDGQLGLNDRMNRYAPVAITDLGQFDTIAAASAASFARRSDGTVFAWGKNIQAVNAETLGDGTYVRRVLPAVVLREGGAGRLDTNDWFLDLKPSVATKNIPISKVPRALAIASDGSSEGTVSLTAKVTYKQADLGRSVGLYALGYVPAAFLNQVRTVPGTPKVLVSESKEGEAKADENFVVVQLTPQGWGVVSGQLSAFFTGTATAVSAAHSILNGINAASIPGARFCVGYAEGGNAVLDNVALRDVLEVPGAVGTSEQTGACVFTGAYLTGPVRSAPGATLSFTASVVGVAPTGNVRLLDNGTTRATQALSGASSAVRSTVFTVNNLVTGQHTMAAGYLGDSLNPASTSPGLIHFVSARTATAASLSGPAASHVGASVTFSAALAAAATGFVRFGDGDAELGSSAIANGSAVIVTSSLAAGSHSIVASYEGDATFAPSASAVLAHNVVAASQLTLALAAAPARPRAGEQVTLTATTSGGVSPTGSVHFLGADGEVAAASLQGGTASVVLGALPAGSHTFIARLDANGSNATATSLPLGLQVLPAQGAMVTLAVSVAGQGTVSSTPAGVNCTGACQSSYAAGTSITLAATPAQGWAFSGWSLPHCTQASSCAPDLAASATVTATFAQAGEALNPSVTSLDFGGQSLRTTSLGRTLSIENRSADVMAIERITTTGGVIARHQCTQIAAGASCIVTLTFSPETEGTVNGSVVVIYNYGTSRRALVVAVAGRGERSLVAHYYQAILRRLPDTAGRAYWDAEHARVAALGANPNETWYAMAMSFFGSAEYTGIARNTTEFIRDLYVTFLNREADAGGLGYWTGLADAGMPREVLTAAFMFSPEFLAFSQSIFGNPTVRQEIDTVVDFYRGLLSRLPDNAGFNHWIGAFRAAQCQGAAAVYGQVEAISAGFAEGAEYSARTRSSAQYVGDLYNAFLRRGGDLEGVRYWIGQLDTGARTRAQLRREFMASAEFAQRVARIVGQGCIPQ